MCVCVGIHFRADGLLAFCVTTIEMDCRGWDCLFVCSMVGLIEFTELIDTTDENQQETKGQLMYDLTHGERCTLLR